MDPYQPPQSPAQFPGAPAPEGPGPNYVKAALVGGLIGGIPSPFLACCCFLFFGIGGVVGAMVAARTAPVFRAMEGAISGLAAAIAGGILYAVIYVPMTLALAHMAKSGQLVLPQLPGMPPGFDLSSQLTQQADPMAMAMHLMMAGFVFLVSGTLGGCAYGLYLNRAPYPPNMAPPPGY